MRFRAQGALNRLLSEKAYYSVAGGFVIDSDELGIETPAHVHFAFASSVDLLALCRATKLSIAVLQMANEAPLTFRSQVEAGLEAIVEAMFGCE